MKRLRYREGDWFAIPLRDGSYARGVVTHLNKKGILLGYFFGPALKLMPTTAQGREMSPDKAVFVALCGDLGFVKERWRVVGPIEPWSRERWRIPRFVRKDIVSGSVVLVTYDDELREVVTEMPPIEEFRSLKLPEDGVWGAGAVETRLTDLLRRST